MSRKGGFKVARVGVVACAACCAGPIVGLFTATGLATIAGFVMSGVAAIVLGAVMVALFLWARSRKRAAVDVPVEITARPPDPADAAATLLSPHEQGHADFEITALPGVLKTPEPVETVVGDGEEPELVHPHRAARRRHAQPLTEVRSPAHAPGHDRVALCHQVDDRLSPVGEPGADPEGPVSAPDDR